MSNNNSSKNRDYVLRGGARYLFEAQDTEVVLSGPAGTGKSCAAWAKLHTLCELVPGLRCLAVRKTRESLTESGLVTFESRILPPDHPVIASGGQRRMRQAYAYPNGSTIVLGGLDKPNKVMSTEFDLIYVQEAIELKEGDWEALLSRLRNGRLPYQQLLADTNPDAPGHWIKRRHTDKKLRLIESRHEDNPSLYDDRSRQYTPAGVSYLAKLDALTGMRKLRLRHGRWVQAEGVVYEGYDASVHLIDRFEIPLDWDRIWVVDFGYTHPFVWQAWCRDEDGRLYRYKEIHHSRVMVEDHARQILDWWQKDECAFYAKKHQTSLESIKTRLRPKAIISDHDREDRATLEKHLKMATIPARKDVMPGIQAVQSRLRVLDDKKARLYFMRDSLMERDKVRDDLKLPCCFEEEVDAYVFDEKKEAPIKENDDACDCVRYAVAHYDLRAGHGKECAPETAGGEHRKLTPEEAQNRGMRLGEGPRAERSSKLFGR